MAESALPKDSYVGEVVAGDSYNYGEKTIYVNCSMTDPGRPRIPEKIHFYPPPTPHFHGREQTLIVLTNSVENVQRFENCYEKMIVISGLGGMGKSEIVKVMAKRLKDRFPYIFWLNAQSRTSLDSSFQDLLCRLNVKLGDEEKTPSQMTLKAYRLLEQCFARTIFIFDNAEFLKSEPNSASGYLLPNDELKKPVFIVTTRNDWRSLEQPTLKIIRLDELSKEEAKVCFLKYLRLEGLKIPPSLSTTIDKLVQIVQGHPLGISLMGNEAARQEQEIFGDVEKRISNYLRLLEAQPLEELTGQEKYEWNLQVIFDERMRKLETTKAVRDAGEILRILSHLSPDDIFVGLVNGIFSRKIFYPQRNICESFPVGESELRVERALKLLQSNSLIRIESAQISYCGNFDVIRIHRLVQSSAGKSKSVLLQPTHAFNLIVDFFATNEDNVRFQGQILSTLKSLEGTAFPLQNLKVLSLIYEFAPYHPTNEERDEVGGFLSSREWNAQERLVVSLIKIHLNPKSEEKQISREIKESMLRLCDEFFRRGWILQLCTQVLHKFIDDFDDMDLSTLQNRLKKCYMDCPSVNRYFPNLLECVYSRNDLVNDADGEFVLKIFSKTSERQRGEFWLEMNNLHKGILMRLVPYFFSCSDETNLFAKSLQFPTKELKIHFWKDWAKDFRDCVRKVIENEEMREKLLAKQDFAQALQDITKFGFNEIPRELDYLRACGIQDLLQIWLELFCAHELTYERFGEFVDELAIHIPEFTQCKLFNYWTGVWLWNELKNLSSGLTSLEYCSTTTKSWIQSWNQTLSKSFYESDAIFPLNSHLVAEKYDKF